MYWDRIAHVAAMTYNVFLHSSSGEAPFYLMLRWDAYMPTLFKLLLPKIIYMGDEHCRIHLDAMRGIYILTVLYLKTARDECLSPIKDHHEADFKVEDMVLLKSHTTTTAFDVNYKTSYQICQ